MAILLNQTLSTGVQANYLRISRIVMDRNSQMVLVDVGLYLSQAARASGNDPVQLLSIDLSSAYNSLVSETGNHLVSAVYLAIMTLPGYEGALSC